ncbi:Uu.00g018300.m01.CDS01 [Anthostomella pinea]|uniref:Uu.00g018300.m01.CDS01 n=1 Tax=Anthostomella pinea TaxID=933095 RepID=A0AAI8VZ45_9PEZI|nr:Uu.00g018300.m01.CDS01 [Anthostomella pinea]
MRLQRTAARQSQQIYQLSMRPSPSSYPPSQVDYPSEFAQQSDYLQPTPADTLDSPQFLIPKNHATLASTLLSLPPVRDRLGDIPRDFFFQVEEKQPLPVLLSSLHDGPLVWPPLTPRILDELVGSYFHHAHPHHPLFTLQNFKLWHTRLLEHQDVDDIGTAICLCVYSLGAVCSAQGESQKSSEALGLEYFQPALKIILKATVWGFRPDLNTCQALLLAASYFAHLGRPLHSWRMAQFASRIFLNLVESRKRYLAQAEFDDIELCTFWQCFMVECDRVAELDVPRSGIEPLGDKMPLPHSADSGDDENRIHITFIAEHAIRRLLNRIHNALYSPDNTHDSSYSEMPTDPTKIWQRLSLQRLLSLSSELNRQLEEWYTSIPDYLRPPKGTDTLPNDRARVLRIRYYAAKQIIHRPYLLQAVSRTQEYRSPSHSPMMGSDPYKVPVPVVLEKCQTCIDSCVAYVFNAVEMIDKRSPYLWTFSQSCMACLVMLWMADNSPSLRQFVPAMQPIQNMVLAKLRKWTTSDSSSSFDAEVRILERLSFPDHMDT